MSLCLVEAAKRSGDTYQPGVVELLVKNDPLLQKLGVTEIVGNGLTYWVETTMAGAQFYAPGDLMVESGSTQTKYTAGITILGGDVEIDKFLQKTRSNINDIENEEIQAKIKAIKYAFLQNLIYGYVTGNAKSFDGLHYLLRSRTYNTLAIGANATPAALSLSQHVLAAKNMIKGYTPGMILCSKGLSQSIYRFLMGVGGLTPADVQAGELTSLVNLPLYVTDFIGDNESCDLDYGSSHYGYNYADGVSGVDDDGSTSMFILSFDPKSIQVVQNGSLAVNKVTDNMETKNARLWRALWYCSVMMQSVISCSKITGIDVDGTVVV